MFNTITNSTIDMVTLTKKSFIELTIPQESLKKPLTNFIDTQTQYTKDAIETFTNIGFDIGALFFNKSFYTESVDIFQSNLNTVLGKRRK